MVSGGRGGDMLGGAGGVRQTGHRVAELVPGEPAGPGPASAVWGGDADQASLGGGGNCRPGNEPGVRRVPTKARAGKGGWKVEEQRSRRTGQEDPWRRTWRQPE